MQHVISDNLLCETERISRIAGEWVSNSDCSWNSTEDRRGSIIWFGDDNGNIPDSSLNNLISFTLTLNLSIDSCSINSINCNGGLVFHAKNVSDENDRGYYYVFLINFQATRIQIASVFNEWSWIEDYVPPSLSLNTIYQLKIISNGLTHSFYFNNTKIYEHDLCDLQNGSFGLRTFLAPTVFYSLTIEENSNQSLTQSVIQDSCSAAPTNTPSDNPTSYPTSQPTSLPTLQPTNKPTIQPTVYPSDEPTTHPTVQPTGQPTSQPTNEPTKKPITQSTVQPSDSPTSIPISSNNEQDDQNKSDDDATTILMIVIIVLISVVMILCCAIWIIIRYYTIKRHETKGSIHNMYVDTIVCFVVYSSFCFLFFLVFLVFWLLFLDLCQC